MRSMHTVIARGRRLRAGALAAACAVLALSVAACGPPSSSRATASASATSTSAAGGGGSPIVAQARQAIDTLYQGHAYHAPPSSGPKPEPGKNVWVITPGLSLAGSGLFAAATQAAGKAVGWKGTG